MWGQNSGTLGAGRGALLAWGGDSLSGLTGMMVTVRVADSRVSGTVPEAKPLKARRRRRKFWALKPFYLIFEWFLSGFELHSWNDKLCNRACACCK